MAIRPPQVHIKRSPRIPKWDNLRYYGCYSFTLISFPFPHSDKGVGKLEAETQARTNLQLNGEYLGNVSKRHFIQSVSKTVGEYFTGLKRSK